MPWELWLIKKEKSGEKNGSKILAHSSVKEFRFISEDKKLILVQNPQCVGLGMIPFHEPALPYHVLTIYLIFKELANNLPQWLYPFAVTLYGE